MSERGWTMKVTGKAVLKVFSFRCLKCAYTEEQSIDMRDKPDDFDPDSIEVKCPNCENTRLERYYGNRAPSFYMGGANSDRAINSMKQSFKKRYVKKELDDVKHTWGDKIVNESLVAGEAARIKDGLKDKE